MMFQWLINQTEKKFLLNKNNEFLIEELKAAGIEDNNILNAIKKVPREFFVKKDFIKEAYKNIPLPIDCGQTISQPYIVAYMISCLNLKKTDKILEVGTGTGYQTALLSHMCNEVYTIEIFSKLLNQAKINIRKLNLRNVNFILGNAMEGYDNKVLFDFIIISAASEKIPTKLLDNLKDKGSLIMPKKYSSENQKLLLIKKNKNGYFEQDLLSVKFVSLLNRNPE